MKMITTMIIEAAASRSCMALSAYILSLTHRCAHGNLNRIYLHVSIPSVGSISVSNDDRVPKAVCWATRRIRRLNIYALHTTAITVNCRGNKHNLTCRRRQDVRANYLSLHVIG